MPLHAFLIQSLSENHQAGGSLHLKNKSYFKHCAFIFKNENK